MNVLGKGSVEKGFAIPPGKRSRLESVSLAVVITVIKQHQKLALTRIQVTGTVLLARSSRTGWRGATAVESGAVCCREPFPPTFWDSAGPFARLRES